MSITRKKSNKATQRMPTITANIPACWGEPNFKFTITQFQPYTQNAIDPEIR